MYAAEMGISLYLPVDRYTLEDAQVKLFYHLRLGDGSYEEVPMGIFEVSEANRTAHFLELKAYDHMLRFERDFNGFESVGTAYDFMGLCAKACRVELAQTAVEIGGCIASISGQAMAAAAAWDGKIEIGEYVSRKND